MKGIHYSILWVCLIFCILSVLFIPSAAYACSCIKPQSVEAEFNRSESVFAGRVLEVKEKQYLNGSATNAVLFEASRIWKGVSESQIIIHTGLGGGDCGFHFEKGKDYLVYAHPSNMYGNKELLVTISCDRTNEFVQAQEDLAFLGEGKAPTKQVHLESELYSANLYVWIIVIGIPTIGIILYLVWRKGGK